MYESVYDQLFLEETEMPALFQKAASGQLFLKEPEPTFKSQINLLRIVYKALIVLLSLLL